MKNEFSKMDAGSLHLENKRVLLKLINQRGQISRSELSKETRLTPRQLPELLTN